MPPHSTDRKLKRYEHRCSICHRRGHYKTHCRNVELVEYERERDKLREMAAHIMQMARQAQADVRACVVVTRMYRRKLRTLKRPPGPGGTRYE